MRTMDERRGALRAVGAFAQVAPGDLDTLLACLRWRTLAAGDVLFRQGDYGDALVVIAEGSLSVRVRRAEAEVEVARAGAGEIVGEMACVDPAPRSATLVALGTTVVAELSRDALKAMRAGAPALAAVVVGAVIREVTRRLREIEGRVDHAAAPPSSPTLRPPPVAPATLRPPASAAGPTAPPPVPPSAPPGPEASERSSLQRLLDRVRGRA